MNSITSLQISQNALWGVDDNVLEELTTASRAVFDQNGVSVVTPRDTNIPIPTIREGSRVYEHPHYVHLLLADDRPDRSQKSTRRAADTLEEGLQPHGGIDQKNATSRSGYEPLADTAQFVAVNEFGFNPDALIELKFDRVVEVHDDKLFPGETVFSLRASAGSSPEADMMSRTSEIAELALRTVDARVANIGLSKLSDSMPIAVTASQDAETRRAFRGLVDEMLPVTVHIEPGLVHDQRRTRSSSSFDQF